MESANFLEHRQEEDNKLVMDSSCYGISWYHNHMLNDANINAHELVELQQIGRIKNELPVTGSGFELPDIITSSPTSSNEDFMSNKNNNNNNNNNIVTYNNDNHQDMLFKTFSNGCRIKHDHVMNPIVTFDESMFTSFNHIFPTLKFSNLNQPASSFDVNLPALDPFGYPTFNGSTFNCQPASSFNSHNLGDILKDNCLSYSMDQMHSKIASTFIVETTEAKWQARNDMGAKAPKPNPTKKSKVELRPSCTQLKVRKEKLGDRILALQQMVAPFGKTDTASVLMEAIGYIKFLQNQVETLSVPYKNATDKPRKISKRGGLTDDENEEKTRDLRSRGLCLVPVSCLTYVTYGTGGSV